MFMERTLKTIRIIHIALCTGLIAGYVILGGSLIEGDLQLPEINESNAIFLAFPIFGFVMSNVMFRVQLKAIKPELSIEEKMPILQTACIIRWALIEGACFAILIIQPEFIVFGIILIGYLAFLHPTKNRVLQNIGEKDI